MLINQIIHFSAHPSFAEPYMRLETLSELLQHSSWRSLQLTSKFIVYLSCCHRHHFCQLFCCSRMWVAFFPDCCTVSSSLLQSPQTVCMLFFWVLLIVISLLFTGCLVPKLILNILGFCYGNVLLLGTNFCMLVFVA